MSVDVRVVVDHTALLFHHLEALTSHPTGYHPCYKRWGAPEQTRDVLAVSERVGNGWEWATSLSLVRLGPAFQQYVPLIVDLPTFLKSCWSFLNAYLQCLKSLLWDTKCPQLRRLAYLCGFECPLRVGRGFLCRVGPGSQEGVSHLEAELLRGSVMAN